MSALDLSRLKPVELPKQELEIQLKDDFNVNPETGEKTPNIQKIEVHAISGEGVIAWSGNHYNHIEAVQFEAMACLTALIYGADIPEEQARLLMNYDRENANKISIAVWILTNDFYSAKKEEKEKAEKNSETAGMNTVV